MTWELKPKAPRSFLKKFPQYSPLTAQLLHNRGLKNQEQIGSFFNPDFQKDLHNPFLLKGMKKAVERIQKAIKENQKIVVYGDYDADGVCSCAILFFTLKSLCFENFSTYIPDRRKEGYGLNNQAVKNLAQAGTQLIITVDCGVRDLEEIDLANSLGMDVIVTDHHQTSEHLPKAYALINPWQKGDKYPFKRLAGAGIAYKLACALIRECHSQKFGNAIPESFQKWLLDLTAIATVADVMPIINENRVLVKYGLGVLAQTRWLGLSELMKTARLNPQVIKPSVNGQAPLTNLDAYALGFVIGPRLNAAGRMDHADRAFYLLIADNQEQAQILAQEINQSNISRQGLTDKIVQEIKARLAKQEAPKLIFEGSPHWPLGLIGVAAGKIKDVYGCPTIIYHEKDKMIRASCRSIDQFNLIKSIEKAARLLDDFGGHKTAAGFSAKKKKLSKIKKIFNEAIEKELGDKETGAILGIEAELSLADITLQNYQEIEQFAPFGKGNPEPRFLVKALQVNDLRIVGSNGRHLKMELRMVDEQSMLAKNFKAIGFGLADWLDKLKPGDLIDVVFELIIDQWLGYRDLQMKIIDIKNHK